MSQVVAIMSMSPLGEPLLVAHQARHLGDAYRRLGRAELAEPSYIEAGPSRMNARRVEAM